MRVRRSVVMFAALLAVPAARADVTGSFEGQLAAKKQAPVAAAGTFTQAGKLVSGTVVVGGDAATGGGSYLVQGRGTAKRIRVTGFAGGAKLTWKGRVKGDVVRGKAVIKVPGSKKRNGTLTLTKNAPAADGAACDAVYTANEQQFTTDLFSAGAVLSLCTECHVPGGQAQSTRFRITVSDPLATARSIAAMVDSANPAASRILAKPTQAVPHGGLQVLLPGSEQESKLRAWVDLVAAAGCI